MKKLLFVVSFLSFVFPLSLQSTALELSLKGGAEIYADSLSFGGILGLHAPLKELAPSLQKNSLGLVYLGLSAFYYQGKKDDIDFSHMGGGIDGGYIFPLGDNIRFIPLVFIGLSKGKIEADGFVSIDSLGYSLMPGFILDYAITSNFLLGIRAGYQFYGYSTKESEVSGSMRGFLTLLKISYRL